jgi:hypothetical protein
VELFGHWFDSHTRASGAVLRNHEGDMLAGRAKWYANCLDALTMEAMPCIDGMQTVRLAGG